MTRSCPRALDHWGDYDRDHPFPLFAEVRAAGAVHDVTLADGHRAFLVVGYHAAREALNHPDLSKDMHAALALDGAVVAAGLPGPDFARHMLSVDPPDHTRLRGLATKAFTRTRLLALEPRIREIVAELLDDLAAQGAGPVDLVAGFAGPLPFAVIGVLLGIERKDQRRLAGWFATLLAPYAGAESPAEAVAASDHIVGYLVDLVEASWSAPTDDLVGDLVQASQEGALTRQELLSTVFQLVVAGHDTTTSLIGNGVAALLAHPEQRDALVADLSLVPRAVEEFLRWDAPVPHSTFRYAARDVTIAGTTIPAGVQVLVSLAAAGRDPDRNPDAEAFDIARTDAAHLAFGHGIHHCLGARLARLEAGIAFTSLLARFPRMQLAIPPEELRWQHGDGLVLRGLSELPVTLSESGDITHQHGNQAVALRAIAELAEVVGPPALGGAGERDPARGAIRCADGRPASRAVYSRGGQPVHHGAVAELAISTRSPAPRAVIDLQTAGVTDAAGDRGPGGRGADLHRLQVLGRRTVAELSVFVVSPAPQRAVDLDSACVSPAAVPVATHRDRCPGGAGSPWPMRSASPDRTDFAPPILARPDCQ